MTRYFVRRLLQSLLTVLGVSVVIFVLLRAIPGDPAGLLLAELAGHLKRFEDIQRLLVARFGIVGHAGELDQRSGKLGLGRDVGVVDGDQRFLRTFFALGEQPRMPRDFFRRVPQEVSGREALPRGGGRAADPRSEQRSRRRSARDRRLGLAPIPLPRPSRTTALRPRSARPDRR